MFKFLKTRKKTNTEINTNKKTIKIFNRDAGLFTVYEEIKKESLRLKIDCPVKLSILSNNNITLSVEDGWRIHRDTISLLTRKDKHRYRKVKKISMKEISYTFEGGPRDS